MAAVPKLGFWPAYVVAMGLYLAGVGIIRLVVH